MGLIGKIIGGTTDIPKIVESVGNALDKVTTTDQERLQLELELRKAEIQMAQVEMQDRSSARELQKTAIQSDDKFTKRFLPYLSIASLILGFIYVFLVTLLPIPANNQRMADTILGVVISLVFSAIYQFWFGSSYGSIKKTDLLLKK